MKTTKEVIVFDEYQYKIQLDAYQKKLGLEKIIKAIEAQYPLVNFSTDFFKIDNPAFYNLYLWLHNKTGGLFEDEGNESPVGNFDLTDSKGAWSSD